MEINSLLDKFICENIENVIELNLDEELKRLLEHDEDITNLTLKNEPKEGITNYVWSFENECLIKCEDETLVEQEIIEIVENDQQTLYDTSSMIFDQDIFITQEVTLPFDPYEEILFEIVPERPGNVSCNICHRTFTKTSYLIQHNRYKHSDKFFKCAKCRKSFAHEDALENHLQKHQNANKPFKCEVDGCQKAYAYKADLKIHHLNNHKKDMKSYVCDFNACGKKFSRSDHLKKHKATHVRSIVKKLGGGVKKGMKKF